MAPRIDMECTEDGAILAVALQGAADIAAATTLQALLLEASGRGADLAVDLTRVNRMDGAGVQLLLAAQRALESAGHGMTITAVSAEARRALEVAGATSLSCSDDAGAAAVEAPSAESPPEPPPAPAPAEIEAAPAAAAGPSFDVDSLLDAFFEEAAEHVAAFEGGLLELEPGSPDAGIIATIFRAAHSIKGASGIFGFAEVMSFTHVLETLLDRVRNGQLAYSEPISTALLGSVDALRSLLTAAATHSAAPAQVAEVRVVLERLARQGLPEEEGAHSAAAPAPAAIAASAGRCVSIAYAPLPQFMSRGMDPLSLLKELEEGGTVVSRELDASRLPDLAELDAEAFYLSFVLTLRTTQTDAQLREVFTFALDLCTFAITTEVEAGNEGEGAAPAGPAHAEPVTGSGAKAEARAAESPGPAAAAPAATIRVSTDKVDKLLDLVGELVIAQAMIVEATRSTHPDASARLSEALGAMERHTRDLQERVMSIRMVPLSTVFRRLPRMVHDLSAVVQKRVKLEIEGEGTEIDKSMVEQLVDPLTHLVRNAIDHGLESSEDRLGSGKGGEGTVTVRAYHQGGNVVIEVADDGRGLNREAVRDKAVRQGLIAADADLTDDQVNELIFRPGFSTAAKVSDISGRGVGMDVVKRNIEALNGSLTLSSELGHGTNVRMRLPLTLAILEGLAVRVGRQTFVVPLLSVVETFRPKPAQIRAIFGTPEVIDVRGTSLPIVRLHAVMGTPDAEPDPCKALVCVVESYGGNLAVLVDEVLGQHQVVLKSLEMNYRKIDGVMGATILGDGRVAMILDLQSLARSPAPPPAFDHRTAALPSMELS